MPGFRSRPRTGAVVSALGVTGVLLAALTGCTDSDVVADHPTSVASPTFGSEGTASPSHPDSVPPSLSGSATPSGSPSSAPGSSLSVRDGLAALDTAARAVPGGRPYHLAHDDEGEQEWEVKVASKGGGEWAVSVSEEGDKVTDKHEDKTPDDSTDELEGFTISVPEAVRTAAGRHPGDDLTEVALEKTEKGTSVWSVTTKDGTTAESAETRTLIDAKTGKVTHEKREH